MVAIAAQEKNPQKRIFWTLILVGASQVVLSTSMSSGFAMPVILVSALVALSFGVWGLRALRGVRPLALALNQAGIGKLDVADALIAMTERSRPVALVRKQAALVRAHVALSRGDAGACLEHAGRALDGGAGPFARAAGRSVNLSALALRGFASALLGEKVAAERDFREVRRVAADFDMGAMALAGDRILIEPVARVALGEAILLSRDGGRPELRAHLEASRSLVMDMLTPRERILFRGLARMARAHVDSPYRAVPPKPIEPSGDEPSPEDWVERVLPEVSPFVARPTVRSTTAALPPPPAATSKPRTAIPAKVPSTRRPALARVAMLLSFAAVMIAILRAMVLRPSGSDRSVDLSLLLSLPVLLFVLLGGLIGRNYVRLRRDRKATSRAFFAGAKGDRDAARSMLSEVAQRGAPLYAARAALSLAEGHAREGDFEASLGECDRGLAHMTHPNSRGAVPLLTPALVAERAAALAALGHPTEALKLAVSLPTSFSSLARAQFRVKLLSYIGVGQFEEAAAFARSRPPHLPIDARTELLADVVVTTRGQGLGAGEAQQVREDMSRHAERDFVKAVSPELFAVYQRGDVGAEEVAGLDANPDSLAVDREAAALREAEAEEGTDPPVAATLKA